jgi:hypothetical protein
MPGNPTKKHQRAVAYSAIKAVGTPLCLGQELTEAPRPARGGMHPIVLPNSSQGSGHRMGRE